MSIMEVFSRIDRKWLERKTKRELSSIILNNLDRIDLFAEESQVETKQDRPLHVSLSADGVLGIQIGINTLALAFNRGSENNPYDEGSGGFKRLWQVTDAVEFAKEIDCELCREEEDGSTPVTTLLDKMFSNALDHGCFGVEEDGRIDPE
jgi:hypothetical protein